MIDGGQRSSDYKAAGLGGMRRFVFHNAKRQPKRLVAPVPPLSNKLIQNLQDALAAAGVDQKKFAAAYEAGNMSAAAAAIDFSGSNDLLFLAMKLLILDRMEQYGQKAARDLADKLKVGKSIRKQITASLKPAFNLTNPRAQEFAATEAGELITQINTESLDSIRQVLEQAYSDGRTVQEVGRMLRSYIGLNAPQQLALAKFYSAQIANGLTPAQAAEKADKYSARLLRQRATMIARTELVRSSNFGQEELWRQAQEDGFIGPKTTRVWIITADDRICPICEPMRGVTARLGEPFVHPETGEQYDTPGDVHPNDRCSEALDEMDI